MDLQAINDNNKDVDSEIGAFQKFKSESKNTIFGVVFVLLKEQEFSLYTTIILALIQFIQLMIFPFHKTIYSVWNSHEAVDVIEQIVNYFNIVPYLDSTNWDLYIILFYIGIASVGITIINSLYASYAFSQNRFTLMWPILALRYMITLFNTVLFLPLIEYFVSILACTESINGKHVHSYFSNIECWKEMHILHSIFAIVGIILFVIITSVTSLTYFEYKSISNNPNARTNSRSNLILIVYKLIMVICLTFLTDDQYQVLLLAVIFIGSLVIFVKFHFGSPYHNGIISKTWSILTALNIWTATLLVFAKIMEKTLFKGSIIGWLIGIPFVVFIILTNKDHRVDLLLINVNKFQTGREVQDQIRYLLKLIEWQSAYKNSAILLDGYIEIHKQSCNQDDCPLKKNTIKNNRFIKNLMSKDENLNEKYALLIQLLYKMYSQGIKKFPNNSSLRIAYAFFLLEKMQSKQQALQELTSAEQSKPSFDEQFIIFRYKKIIEDEIAESQQEGQEGLDVVSEAAFQNHLRQLQANVEKSALLHMEFWSQLSEDNPDLAKLHDIGSKINSSVHNIEEHWLKLLKINSNNAKAMRLYGRFLIEIINDKEAGDELLEKAQNLTNVQSNKKAIQMVGASGDDNSNDATPTVWVSGEQSKFAMITGINLAAANLFGYNKNELLNRKMNVLMPNIYGKHHDSFLSNYLETGEGTIVNHTKERLIFGKNKSNYIFPIFISLRAVQSIIQGIQFIATFRVERNFKNAAYVLTAPDGTIDSVSSSCISLLKIDTKVTTNKKANIQDFIPNIIKNRFSMFTSVNVAGRASTTVNFNFPQDSEYLLETDEPFVQLNCHLSDIVFLGGRENAGLQLKFERILDKSVSAAHADKKAKISNFQFKFDKTRPIIMGEYAEGGNDIELYTGPNDEMLDVLQNTDQNQSGVIESNFSSARKSQLEEEVQVQTTDYGLGIRTLRLFNGKPQEIEDDKGSEEDEEAESTVKDSRNQADVPNKHHQETPEEENQEEGSYKDFSTTFKSKKALTAVINDKTPPPAIKSLRYTANFLVIILFVTALIDYVISISEFDKINTDINHLDKSNVQISELMHSLSVIRDLYTNNMGLTSDLAITNVTRLMSDLQATLDMAKTIKEELEQETSSLSDAHLKLLNQPVITLYNLGGSTTKKGLTQATEELISRAYSILSRNISTIGSDDGDYYYVTYNLLNGYYQGLKDSSQYYALGLFDRVDQRGGAFLILLLASIATLIIGVMILFPILSQVNKTREEVLSLFLDIPDKTVKGLYNKCETFITNLQVGEDEDIASEIDEEDIDKHQTEQEPQDFIPRRRKKRFKNTGRNQRAFFAKFLIVALVIEGYFLYAYISANVLLGDIYTFIPELNATSVAEPFFSFAQNSELQLFLDSSFPILNGSAEVVATNNIKTMYDLDSLILEEHSINRKIHSKEYANIFSTLMISNPCPDFVSFVDNATCVGFADHTVYKGMTVALARYFENSRNLLSCYNKLKVGSTCNVTPTNTVYLVTDNNTNTILNLARTAQSQETVIMQRLYIKNTFRILMEYFKQNVKDSIDNALTIRLIVFIIFLVLLFMVYMALWQTLVRNITTEIWRTKSMLNMIPLNVIAKIKSIRLYLKRFWKERNSSEYEI